MKDIYQERYEKHQDKKKKQLLELLDSRASQRIFNDKPVSPEELGILVGSMAKVPSSCGRQAVYARVVSDRTRKEMLGALLVGGVGWIHRADKVVLLFADPLAYKENLVAMPYLDAGAVLQNSYLVCEDLGIGCCFVNMNVREENKLLFAQNFNNSYGIFCGALAIGHYDKKAPASKKKKDITIK